MKEDLFDIMNFTESIPLLTPNHSLSTCRGPEPISSSTIYKKRGVKTSSRDARMVNPVDPFQAPIPNVTIKSICCMYLQC